jgi:hypothetical protein
MKTPDTSKRKPSVIFTKYEHQIYNDDGHEPQQQRLGHEPAQTSTMLDLSIIQQTTTA